MTHRPRLAATVAFSIAGAATVVAAAALGFFSSWGVPALIAVFALGAVLLATAATIADGTIVQAYPLTVLIAVPVATAAAVLVFESPALRSAGADAAAAIGAAVTAAEFEATPDGLAEALRSAGASEVSVIASADEVLRSSFVLDAAHGVLASGQVCVRAWVSPIDGSFEPVSVTLADPDRSCTVA